MQKLQESTRENGQEAERLRDLLSQANRRAQSSEQNQSAKNAQIEIISDKYNEVVKAAEQHWHYQVDPSQFIHLTVETRVTFDDIVWCLVKWKKPLDKKPLAGYVFFFSLSHINLFFNLFFFKKKKKKGNKSLSQSEETQSEAKTQDTQPTADQVPTTDDSSANAKNKDNKFENVYFWTTQTTFLTKLNAKEDEVYLPDLLKNKIESMITKNFETERKTMQKRIERQIQEL
ncbi:hypothetical protein RFI_20033, partial [Reticulomyxa filosa]